MRILILLILFVPVAAQGQILNIDKSDTADYSNQAKASFNFTTGLEIDKQRTTLYDATNTAEALLQHRKNLLLLAASYRFTYNGPDDILNAGYFHLRYRRNYKDRFQPEPFLQYQWDNRRGLMHRSLAGMNIRYNFFKGDTWNINAGIGLMYEAEKWNYDGVDSNKIPAIAAPIVNHLIKLNSYIRLNWKASDNSDVILSVFVQGRPTHFQPRIAPSFQWNINAGKHLGFSVSFAGIYDDAPVVPIGRFYYGISNGIVVRL